MTSKYLYDESWATQYELSTLKPPKRRPTRSYLKQNEEKERYAISEYDSTLNINELSFSWVNQTSKKGNEL